MASTRLARPWRVVVFLTAAALVAGTGLLPGRLSSPVQRLVNVDADTASPIYDIPVDDAAMRRAGEIVPDDAFFYFSWPSDEPQYEHDLNGATHLYFSPAIPVRDPARAEWFLGYLVPPAVPEGRRVVKRFRLGKDVELVRVAP